MTGRSLEGGTEPVTRPVFHFLERLGAALERTTLNPTHLGGPDLDGLSSEDRRSLVALLGEGEISGMIKPGPGETGEVRYLRESVYPGIWLLGSRPEGGEGVVLSSIEVGRAPGILLSPPEPSSFLASGGLAPDDPAAVRLRPQLMNALPLMEEAAHHLATFGPIGKNHRIFLNKLPLSEGDAEWIDRVCSQGRISLVSKGYGDCQVLSTGFSGLWRVLYKNPEGIPLLDALSVADIPDEIAATPEDIRQALEDYRDFLEWIARDLS
ncbi:MAG: hydrogenase expression/formation protein [Nitrospiraceae bacterium]|nr:hydrogenase expression/formation protein [Nitrospiraceae bacterium]